MSTTKKLRRTRKYRGCLIAPEVLGESILIGLSNGTNAYRTEVLRITFPNGTWTRVGDLTSALRYINSGTGRSQGDVSEPDGPVTFVKEGDLPKPEKS